MVQRVSSIVFDPEYFQPFSEDLDTSVGALEFRVLGGNFSDNDTWDTVSATTVTLTNNATNFIDLRFDTPAVVANTTALDGEIPHVRLYDVVTSGGAITSVTDKRSFQLIKQILPA